MINLALLGANISHSRSQEMYETLIGYDVNYQLIDITQKENVPTLNNLFTRYNLQGLSITYPYKKYYLSDVQIVSDLIKSIGAINCIRKEGDTFYATNTDFLAVYELLTKKYLNKYTSFIVLGSGNMANVFSVAFGNIQADVKFLSRKKDGDLNNLDYLSLIKNDHTLIINTCSRAFEFKLKTKLKIGFWDMNYSFDPHRNLDQKGVTYYEGIDLLKEQAKFALQFWKFGHHIRNL